MNGKQIELGSVVDALLHLRKAIIVNLAQIEAIERTMEETLCGLTPAQRETFKKRLAQQQKISFGKAGADFGMTQKELHAPIWDEWNEALGRPKKSKP